MKKKSADIVIQNMIRRLAVWAVGVAIILLVPLAMTLANPHASLNGGHGGGWDWTLSDFVFGFVVLFGAGVIYELLAKRMRNKTYKLATGLGVGTVLLLVWINAAVGIIGSDEWPNLMYLGVLAVGIVGCFISRFHPQGMSITLFGMAIAQMVVPVIALIFAPHSMMETPGVGGVFALNAFFMMLFIFSALLFRRARITT